jgi:hypothetical protein
MAIIRRNNSEIQGIAKMQFEFLRISPSYELANQIFNNHENIDLERFDQLITNLYKPKNGAELSESESSEVVINFLKVIKLQTIFGDLSKITFDDWWKKIGGWYYGYENDEAKVELISILDKNQTNSDKAKLLQRITDYVEEKCKSQRKSKTLLVSIPMGISKKKILEQINKLIEEHKSPITPKVGDENRFVLQRFRIDALANAIYYLKAWATMEEPIQLWRFAVLTNINPTIAEGLKFDSKPTKSNLDQRNTLAVLMHRSLTQAQYITENAAHGIFPSRDKCRLPRFDQAEIYERLRLLDSRPKE